MLPAAPWRDRPSERSEAGPLQRPRTATGKLRDLSGRMPIPAAILRESRRGRYSSVYAMATPGVVRRDLDDRELGDEQVQLLRVLEGSGQRWAPGRPWAATVEGPLGLVGSQAAARDSSTDEEPRGARGCRQRCCEILRSAHDLNYLPSRLSFGSRICRGECGGCLEGASQTYYISNPTRERSITRSRP